MQQLSKKSHIYLVVFLGCVFWAVTACALTEDEKNNIELYQKLAPGVVNITSTTLEHDFFFNVVPRQGAGSGSIIDGRGYILQMARSTAPSWSAPIPTPMLRSSKSRRAGKT